MAAQVTFTFDVIANLSITLANYMAKEFKETVSVRRLKTQATNFLPNRITSQHRRGSGQVSTVLP